MMPAVFLDNIERIISLCVLVAISGMISASETALFALTRQQLHRLRQSKTIANDIIIRLRDNPGDLLSTVLLANIAVNILLYSMLGITVTRMAGDSGLRTAVLGVVGFIIVLFGAEIFPKLIAYAVSDHLAPFVALPLRALELVTWPVRVLLNVVLVEPLTRVFSTDSASAGLSPDDLQELVRYSRKEGLIDFRENVLLHQLMDLADLRVSALMVPRVDVVAYNLDDPPDTLVQLITTSRLLRIPAYEGSIDSIQGIVSAKEYLLNPDTPIRQLVRPVHFIPEQARVEALLAHFRRSRSQFAVVVDEYGGLAGVIALEDIVEAIVGELHAPGEKITAPAAQRIDERTYLLNAGLAVFEFCQAFGLPIEESRFNTLGGFVTEKLDRLPQTGDRVVIGPVTLTIVAMKGRRILRIRCELDHPILENPDLWILLGQSPGTARPTGDATPRTDSRGGERP
jgi:CBS domain containing-hemolysin-like protein